MTPDRVRAFAQTAAFLAMVAKEGARISALLRAEGVVDVAGAIDAMANGARGMLSNVADAAKDKIWGKISSLLGGTKVGP